MAKKVQTGKNALLGSSRKAKVPKKDITPRPAKRNTRGLH